MKKIFVMTGRNYRLWLAMLALALPVMQGCKPASTAEKKPDAYGFFPVYGIYLGQTTVEDLWDMDYKPKVERGDYSCDMADDVHIYDHDKDRIFNDMAIYYYSKPEVDPTPTAWKEKFGFGRNLSYSQWMSLFKKLGFSVEEKKETFLSDVQIVSTSPDKSLVFELAFKYTEESKKSGKQNINASVLQSMWIKSKPGNSSDNVIAKEAPGQTSSPTSTSTSTQTRNKASEVEWKNSIPATDGVMGRSTDYTKLKRITAEERKSLQLDQIRLDGVDMNKYLNKQIARGKTIYKDTEGQLETFLIIVEDHATYEYLISYDAQGNYVDCINFGQNMLYAGDLKTGHIEGNKIKLSYSWAEPESEWGEGISMIYTIMDDLHFKIFSWPPKSYPCEMPFMTYESEGSTPLYWQIESITCTGVSGNAYTFTIKGKGKEGCKNASPEERNVRLEPADKTATVTLPAVEEDEAFETEVKALYKGTFDAKAFQGFLVKVFKTNK
jgi:hypothetical protein